MLEGIQPIRDPRLLVGFDKADDAGVFKISEDMALIQTVDFFTPMVDDPFSFGQIAAANALSDVYAMGGEPLTAMNIVCFPQCLDIGILKEILRGGSSKLAEAGVVLVGGHTVDDNEPKYGLSVTGIVEPSRVVANQGAQPGDYLYLTKPLGTGIIATAIKGEMASESMIQGAVASMAQLNRGARDVMMETGVHACTDVTGFGLIGHAMEMVEGTPTTIELWADNLRILGGAREMAAMGLIPAGAYTNRSYYEDRVQVQAGIDVTSVDLLYSPETSGGLLIAVGADRKSILEAGFEKQGINYSLVGIIVGYGPSNQSLISVRRRSDG